MTLSYVLVHGAWHGAWCWRKVVPLLERAGHRAAAVTLTGQGDRAHLASPAIDLSTHVQDVASTLEMEDLDDVVLVGHSYGGMVITGAAEKAAPRLRRLVYLDALVPTDGQCAFDLNSAQLRERFEREAAATGEGYKVAPMSTDLLGIADPAQAEWVRARLTPLPIGCFREPVRAKAAQRIPSTFILCQRFGFQNTAQRCRAQGWPVLEIDSGHDAMVTEPDALAELLLGPSCG
jgi:pimeloyl-ACP methyl ester carboxylesterase